MTGFGNRTDYRQQNGAMSYAERSRMVNSPFYTRPVPQWVHNFAAGYANALNQRPIPTGLPVPPATLPGGGIGPEPNGAIPGATTNGNDFATTPEEKTWLERNWLWIAAALLLWRTVRTEQTYRQLKAA